MHCISMYACMYVPPHTCVAANLPVQAAMQAGLDVFAMDSPEHKELKEVERDLNLMEQVRRDRT